MTKLNIYSDGTAVVIRQDRRVVVVLAAAARAFSLVIMLALCCTLASADDAKQFNQFAYVLGGPGDNRVYQFIKGYFGEYMLLDNPWVPTGEGSTAAAVTPDGDFLYTYNATAQTMSQFRIDDVGHLELLAPAETAALPTTMLLASPNSAFLYAIRSDMPRIAIYSVAANGRLKLLPSSIPTDPNPVNMTFDGSGRFAYVTCGKDDPESTTPHIIDEFRIGANGGLTPLTPKSRIDTAEFGDCLFASSTSPSIYVANGLGITRFAIAENGQLTDSAESGGLPTPPQVFAVADPQYRLIIGTARTDQKSTGPPDEIVVTLVGPDGAMTTVKAYAVDDIGFTQQLAGTLSRFRTGASRLSMPKAEIVQLAVDPYRQELYVYDERSFDIHRFTIRADGQLDICVPQVLTNHPPQGIATDPDGPIAYASPFQRYMFFVKRY